MARNDVNRLVRLLGTLLLVAGLPACDYGGSPSGSVSAASAQNGSPPEPISASLSWAAASGPVAGYRVFESRNAGNFEAVSDVGSPQVTLMGMPGETLQVQVAALDADGNEGPRSDPSEMLIFNDDSVALATSATGGEVVDEALATASATLADAPLYVASSSSAPPPANAAPSSSPPAVVKDDAAAPVRLDLDGDGTSDLLWESAEQASLRLSNAEGQVLATFDRPPAVWELVAISDLDGDGLTDLLWAQESGALALARMATSLESQPALDMSDVGELGADDWIRASGDFDGDGVAELLVQDAGSEALSLWSLVPGAAPTVADLSLAPAAGQVVAGSLDYDGDGDDDLLMQGADGSLAAWLLEGGEVGAVATLGAAAGGDVLASGDFDGDHVADVARRDADGNVELLLLGAGLAAPVSVPGAEDDGTLEALGAGDYDGDGRSDLLWLTPAGDLVVWFLDPTLVVETSSLGNGGGWIPVADWR